MTSFIVLYVIASYEVLITPFSIEVSLDIPAFLMQMHACYLVFFGIHSIMMESKVYYHYWAVAFKIMLNKSHAVLCLRWLETVSSTFQDVAFDGSLLPLFISWCYNHGSKKLPNHWLTRWYYFRDTIGYHSNCMTC